MRNVLVLTVSLLACVFADLAPSRGAAQEGTVHAADTGSDAADVARLTDTPTTSASVPAPIPEATADSKTFRKVANVICSDEVAQKVSLIYSKNRDLFDVCAEQSKYQIFPFSGKFPTPQQIYSLATTKACTALFTACVLANMPQCDISELGLKAVTETLLKVTVDVDNGLPSPDTTRFHKMHMWRRDVNLAQAAGVPYGNDSLLYKEFTRNLWTALTKYNVHVQPDLSIVYNLTDLTSTVNGSSLNDIPSGFFFNTSGGVAADLINSLHTNDSSTASSSFTGKTGDTSTVAITKSAATLSRASLLSTLACSVALLMALSIFQDED